MRLLPFLLVTVLSIYITGCTPPYSPTNITHFLERPAVDSGAVLKVDYTKYEAEYKGFDAVFLVKDFTIEQISSIADYAGHTLRLSKVSHIKYVVLNPEAKSISTFVINIENKTKLIDLYTVVYSPEGETKKYTIQDMRTTLLPNGNVEYKIAYPKVKKGTVIEEGWQTLSEKIFSFENYNIQSSYPIESTTLRLVYPTGSNAQIKKIHKKLTLPITYTEWTDDNTTVLTYKTENLPGVKDEPFSPYYCDMANYFKAQAIQIGGWRIKTYQWSDLSNLYKPLIRQNFSDTDRMIEDTALKITANCNTPIEKLDSIIGWIQQNVKYNNNHSDSYRNYDTQPVDYEYMLTSKLATIDELNALAIKMLRSVGIKSSLILLRDARKGYFDSDFVDFGEFSYIATLAEINDKTYLVFPSEAKIPTTYVPEFIQNQIAMQITNSGDYKFINLSPANCGKSESIQQYKLNIKEDGSVNVVETKIFSGSQAYFFRELFKDIKDEDMLQQMKKLLTYTNGDVKLDKHIIKNLNSYKEPLEIELEYTIDNLVTVMQDEVIFQTGGLFAPGSQEKDKFETDKRNNPIRIYVDNKLEKNIIIEYPKTWKLITELKNSQDSSNFGNATATYSSDKNTLSVNMIRILKQSSESKEKINDLIALIGSKSKLNIPTLIFKKN
ncbi:MAG: transglutaminase domain-containing protein [Candidatus Kapabacteria bacterium]|nr:transglutaminase domain-containing protein [Candidatus Kapabacteria bacterium]